eukprot:TRINITY_DN2552_c0_g1_i1.p1 TRINITY_DN2552_c0_g1~~TRINITY_DN2552_c0_g1_i1.p1  ORF type:complete len:426 (+),score=172.46 TRINITY_DN2552_c0_g1_i1:47-1279(+)
MSKKNNQEEKNFETQIAKQREQQRIARSKIRFWRAPIKTLFYFTIVVLQQIQSFFQYCIRKPILPLLFFIITLILSYLHFIETPYQQKIYEIEVISLYCGYWIVLGILSSVGLGTGLHTFMLYLGPHIAQVTLAATSCNSVDFETTGPRALLCTINSDPNAIDISLWQILRLVQLEAFLWGFGTAIGELPPYFVARAARLAGESLEELEEINHLNEESNNNNNNNNTNTNTGGIWALLSNFSNFAKKVVLRSLGRLGFLGIMLLASIPNPLFDLAGLTCGHLLMPFWTFFGATIIGKAIVKVHIQCIFVITVFSVHRIVKIVEFIESIFPFTQGYVKPWIEKEKAKFSKENTEKLLHVTESDKNVFGRLWDFFLVIMVGYFIISIIDSSVQKYLVERDEQEIQKQKSKKE